jgi:hypothetical protein
MVGGHNNSSGSSFPYVVVIIAGFVLCLVLGQSVMANVMPITFTTHSMESHAYAVSDIDNCFRGNGSKSQFYHDPATDRWLQYCMENGGGGKYNYFRVFECQGGERVVVTQFKQAARKLARYLSGGGGNGYTPVESSPPCT